MLDRFFVDSNVWLYMFLEKGTDKALLAKQFINEKLLNNQVVISWQVLNEITNVLLKNKFSESTVYVIIEWICKVVKIQDFSEKLLLDASDLRRNIYVSVWDSLIVAAAINADCRYIITEDMQHNQTINKTTIVNIFNKEHKQKKTLTGS